MAAQDAADECADGGFVLNEQDGFTVAHGGWLSVGVGFRGMGDGAGGKEDVERGAAPEFGFEFDPAMMLADDPIDRRETQPGSFATFLRGEERFEDAIANSWRDAGAVVAD